MLEHQIKWQLHFKMCVLRVQAVKFMFPKILICPHKFISVIILTLICSLTLTFLRPKKSLASTGLRIPQDPLISNEPKFLDSRISVIRRPYFDFECKKFYKKLYSDATFNKTALASYPGSGNTWLRHLIELSSGIYTGSIYMDIDILSRGFLGEKEDWNSGSTIVQKVHSEFNERYGFRRAILLLRNPYQSIVSFLQFLQAGHTGTGSHAIYLKKDWPAYALGQTYKWISFAKSWIESEIPVLVVHYEKLKQNTTLEMTRICKFLSIECPNINSECFMKHQEGSFHRIKKLKFNPTFSSFMTEKMNNGINFLNGLLQALKHQEIPLEYYSNYRKVIVANLTTRSPRKLRNDSVALK